MSKIIITVSSGQIVDVVSDQDVEICVFNYDDLVNATLDVPDPESVSTIEFRKIDGDKSAIDTALTNWQDEIEYIFGVKDASDVF
jgi:hypothetical protein